jgi:transcription factor SFP1
VDSILMAGTSPAQFNNSPSFHSSSYLPKMEANFMKDFTCCGLTLASLHDLLQHFEETHANAPASRASQSGQGGLPPTNGVSAAGVTAGQTQTQGEPAAHTQHGFQPRQGSVGGFRQQRLGSDGFNRTSLSTVQDMDTLEDMEMDDVGTGLDGLAPIEEVPSPFTSQQQSQFSQNQSQLQPLNVNLANMQQHQGLRTSTPTTPAASQQFGLQNNPTVSSVNTPTLGTVQMQNLTSPESSHPGTPAELDMDFANGFGMGGMGMQGMQGMDMNFGNMNFGNGMNNGMAGFDGTIDQPGKRLFSKQGGGLTQQQLQAAYNNFQKMGAAGDQSELAKRIREQQILAGANIPQLPFQEEVKPFRCPVIGCEKAYKNQNGLKYHKQVCATFLILIDLIANISEQHGHQNQQLKENEDGTFSIVDPLTSIPYPGTVGMEKEKPYRCEVCGKRYKNLNGLKYHRAHAPHCNPELQLNKLANLQGLNVNVAGAGMQGMDTSMF